MLAGGGLIFVSVATISCSIMSLIIASPAPVSSPLPGPLAVRWMLPGALLLIGALLLGGLCSLIWACWHLWVRQQISPYFNSSEQNLEEFQSPRVRQAKAEEKRRHHGMNVNTHPQEEPSLVTMVNRRIPRNGKRIQMSSKQQLRHSVLVLHEGD